MDQTLQVAADMVHMAEQGRSGENWGIEEGQLSWMMAGVSGIVPQLEEQGMALMVDHHEGEYRMTLYYKAEFEGDVDVVGLMVDEKARNRMMVKWYEAMARGYGSREAYDGAAIAFVDAATAMGLNPTVDVELPLTVFSNTETSIAVSNTLEQMTEMTAHAEDFGQAFSFGKPSGEHVMRMMEGMWEVLGIMSYSTQQQLMQKGLHPDNVKSNASVEHSFDFKE